MAEKIKEKNEKKISSKVGAFILEELPREAVVNQSRSDKQNGIEELITQAVTKHINKIAAKPSSYNESLDQIHASRIFTGSEINYEHIDLEEKKESLEINSNIQGEVDKNEEISEEEEPLDLANNVDNEDAAAVDGGVEEILELQQDNISEEITNQDDQKLLQEKDLAVNIEAAADGDNKPLDQESYDQGYKVASEEWKQKFEEELTEAKDFEIALSMLNSGFEKIEPNVEIEQEIAKSCGEIVLNIANKLHLILPTDFGKILEKGLITKLKEHYSGGEVTITVNPNRQKICKQILQSAAINAKLKENTKIVLDENLAENDCTIQVQNSKFEYSSEQIITDVEKIIKRLQSAA